MDIALASLIPTICLSRSWSSSLGWRNELFLPFLWSRTNPTEKRKGPMKKLARFTREYFVALVAGLVVLLVLVVLLGPETVAELQVRGIGPGGGISLSLLIVIVVLA